MITTKPLVTKRCSLLGRLCNRGLNFLEIQGYVSNPFQLKSKNLRTTQMRIWSITLTTDGGGGRSPILKNAPHRQSRVQTGGHWDLVVKKLEGHNSQWGLCRSLFVALEFVIFAMQMQLHHDDDHDWASILEWGLVAATESLLILTT